MPELIDNLEVSVHLLHKNLLELDFLNRIANGHSLSLNGIRKLMIKPDKIYTITDLGCGSGDSLRYISRWAAKNNFQVSLTGVDRNPEVIRIMENACMGYSNIKGIATDYKDYLMRYPHPDIIHCSLFCHHLSDEELLWLLRFCTTHVTTGIVINDLLRTAAAYYSAKIFTRLFFGSELSRNDGPLSVLRAFNTDEVRSLLIRSGFKNFSLSKHWPFRFLVIGALVNNNGHE